MIKLALIQNQLGVKEELKSLKSRSQKEPFSAVADNLKRAAAALAAVMSVASARICQDDPANAAYLRARNS